MSESENLKYLELYMRQSEFFWKYQQAVALVELAVFAGWYKLFKGSDYFLAMGTLILGSIILFILFLIILRASQYLYALRRPALKALPSDLERPLLSLRSSYIGIAIPIVCVVFNIALVLYQLKCT